jgi:hypothetical protein
MSVPFRARSVHRPRFAPSSAAAFVAGGLAATWAAGDASAQSLPETDVEAYGAAMVYVTYAFGAEQGFGIGLEARAGARETEIFHCSESSVGDHPFGGGALRFEWYPSSHYRLLIVAQGGYYFGTTTSTHGELGAGYRWGDDGGFDTVLGAELDISIAALALHFDPTRLELAPAAGLVLPSVATSASGGACYIPGRPRRSDDGIAPLPQLVLNARSRRDAPPQAVTAWSTRARTEWASVPAFRELADQLRALGAPAALVTRCYGAYADELRHAMLAGGHCAQLGEGRVILDRNAFGTRAPLKGPAGLTRLAVESWVDGCLGEGTAAGCAEREAELAQLAGIRETQRTIARDEARHAELGWDILQWALAQGGDEVRRALHAAALARATDRASDAIDASLDAYGIASSEECEAIAAQHRQRCLERLDRTLAA